MSSCVRGRVEIIDIANPNNLSFWDNWLFDKKSYIGCDKA
jgi:hypothetical protein